MKRTLLLSLTALALGGGCATPTPPFSPVVLTAIGDTRAELLRQTVAASLPEQFMVLQSVVFEYRGRTLSAIGLTHIDTPANTFSVAAVSPVGMKLFEISGRDGQVTTAFLAPGMDERGDPVETIAGDIQRVYFDRIPDPDAAVRRREKTVHFTHPTADGTLEHIMGGSPPVLLEKRLNDARGLVWFVTYHAHEQINGKMHPGGIVFTHQRHGYRLILRLKEVLESHASSQERSAPGI